MDQVRFNSFQQQGIQKKIGLVAGAIIVLMLLFPPKAIVTKNPIMNVSQSESAGYHFIFADPAADQKAAGRTLLGDSVDELIHSQIEWGKLFFQLIVVGGAAVVAARFLKPATS